MKHRSIFRFFVFFFFVLFFGCSRNPPQIRQVSWQLVGISDTKTQSRYETLSLFLYTEKGNDAENIYLIQDENRLFWPIPSEEWASEEDQTLWWIGSNNLAMADHSSFPRGEYRIILIDKSGRRTEQTFSISANKNPLKIQDPVLTFKGTQIDIKGLHSYASLRFYGDDNEMLKSVSAESGKLWDYFITDPRMQAAAKSVKIYTYKDEVGLVTGPWDLPSLTTTNE